MSVKLLTDNVRYEPEEKPPPLVTVGSGLQALVLPVA